MAVALLRFLDSTVFHWNFKGHLYFGDARWTFIALGVFALIAVVISVLWTLADKGKTLPDLPKLLYIFSRYYLACLLLIYGTSKIYGYQFALTPSVLAQPAGNLGTHDLFWTFMGASKSYRLFAGVLETIAAILLLFRRTSTIGALLAMMLLINILMLNIAYDTWVKVIAMHLILCCLVTLLPQMKALYHIFILKRTTALTYVPPAIEGARWKWLQYSLKAVALSAIIYVFGIAEWLKSNRNPPHSDLVGIYEIDRFTLKPNMRDRNSSPWKKIVINQFDFLTIHYPNDSVARYTFEVDTASNLLKLRSRGKTEYESILWYTSNDDQWMFKGHMQHDSLEFTSRKTGIHELTLLKGYGKVKWMYD